MQFDDMPYKSDIIYSIENMREFINILKAIILKNVLISKKLKKLIKYNKEKYNETFFKTFLTDKFIVSIIKTNLKYDQQTQKYLITNILYYLCIKDAFDSLYYKFLNVLVDDGKLNLFFDNKKDKFVWKPKKGKIIWM